MCAHVLFAPLDIISILLVEYVHMTLKAVLLAKIPLSAIPALLDIIWILLQIFVFYVPKISQAVLCVPIIIHVWDALPCTT